MEDVKRIYILDAGALLRHKPSLDPETLCLCPEGVVAEVRDRQSRESLNDFAEFWQLGVPEKRGLVIAQTAAKLTGDDNELSKVDISVVALAVTMCLKYTIPLRPKQDLLKMLNKDIPSSVWNPSIDGEISQPSIRVLSGDRALRNLCFALGVPAFSLTNQQTTRLTLLSYKCTACGVVSALKGGRGCVSCGSRQERMRSIY